MNAQTQYTPGPWDEYRTSGPWTAAPEYKLNSYLITGTQANGESGYIATCDRQSENGPADQLENEANAAFIVTACNAHDELVAALRGLLAAFPGEYMVAPDHIVKARAALAKVQP